MADKIKILIVDDDVFLLDMYSLKFKEAGFQVEIAQNGEEAIKKIKEGGAASSPPRVILLDVVMPKMDGLETLRQIKKDKIAENTKIVILTNLGQKEDIEKSLRLGADDYIVKAHFTPTEVLNKVKALLAGR